MTSVENIIESIKKRKKADTCRRLNGIKFPKLQKITIKRKEKMKSIKLLDLKGN